MSHHGNDANYFEQFKNLQSLDLTDKFFEEPTKQSMAEPTEEEMEKIRKQSEPLEENLGATGKFPDGKLNPDDEGEIKIGMTISKGKFIINFGKPVEWVGLTKKEVIQWGQHFLAKSKEM